MPVPYVYDSPLEYVSDEEDNLHIGGQNQPVDW